ncbi:Hemoprotein HemQ, essential component of heme biosynthetic pathway in Gram-positive bacteria [Acidisarcina polymorpha]|uniref:Hemoprotein HemQ, essential component of heme biosynthetic pathway in Gram-positive bacteria n=1 Tax=Acidisarcina polymorpha TaxID=2211140 RepID=A0A2Z5FZI4_9BACT|nr:hydrogen peroxide-dependent heme synthase [Acidisarcina polymorpha]AXC11815.1 Hemoprotein HemQ, essential component of heme biosynthetic pathway in Gram-positive bacteria [Acidisarcina polymorpha]
MAPLMLPHLATVFGGFCLADMSPVPLTLEGASVLHQMFRFRWIAWRALSLPERERVIDEAIELLEPAEEGDGPPRPNQSALYSLVGHKGDLMMVHFRDTVEDLNRFELELAQTDLYEYLEPTSSYLSVVELGLYESSGKHYAEFAQHGIEPYSPAWNAEVKEVLDRQSVAMASRLYPEIPESKYLCFYPMDRRRGEQANWYTVSMQDRQRMMHEHGLIGRRYADRVKQIISGSIGLDDWEWGVDLFADDPVVFKKLIYEMRFDEVSAIYALFGSFYVGVRVKLATLHHWLGGNLGASPAKS